MNYNISKKLQIGFQEAINKVTDELKKEGFGIITVIDLKEKFKEKVGVDFRRYTILGACNPKIAYEAVQLEDKIGVMLPCNILVQEHENSEVEVSAINPMNAMGIVNNERLSSLANEIGQKLQKVIANI
ncbi:hypothetical protein A4D02_17385 [Niastella koreensis]|uniref:DUF302 domain-containing protein n=2 Tax=Niastella koreensis TaxID=354356 RepID=G8TD06_NIAKG|nr:DUF302 domain-containing protein [Niastella koreensis]AEV97215.1 protein of unknown function DUF302 [Niastella koreensis GR20-10]OQP39107.1 hypothetical protein A4D02_17385 [Niastella koreensis]